MLSATAQSRCQKSLTPRVQYKDMLAAHVKELSAQQELLYASNSYALLLIFQANCDRCANCWKRASASALWI